MLDAAEPRSDYPSGEMDRRRSKQIEQWNRFRGFGLDDEQIQEMIKAYDQGLDYQRDHPECDIDEKLDRAMSCAKAIGAGVHNALHGMPDLDVRRRLFTYSTRCAARALSSSSNELSEAAMLAQLLAVSLSDNEDSRDLMVGLAPLHVSAQATSSCAAQLFEQMTDFAPPRVHELLITFGRRTDVTLSSFGWALTPKETLSWLKQGPRPVRWIIKAD